MSDNQDNTGPEPTPEFQPESELANGDSSVGETNEHRNENAEPRKAGDDLGFAKREPIKPAKRRARAARDITPILKDWEYEAGTINVRKVRGTDGQPKLQMRLDLGLLQMEMAGRPDGVRPHGCESLLDYFEQRLAEHRSSNGSELGFHLSGTECQGLREEAVMYYHRYLSLFVLEDFPGVVRDTARNLRVLDLCGKYATDEQDRLVLEQYRPYIVMMNSRASASLLFQRGAYAEALKIVNDGVEAIREFFERFGQEEMFDQSSEVKVLRKFARDIKRKLPVDPMQRLKGQLDRAVKREDYESAAKIRDEIKRRIDAATTSA